jgi:hypothetical protein
MNPNTFFRAGRAQVTGGIDRGPTKQLAFRLPLTLIARLDTCVEELRGAGLEVTRAEVVRLLLARAIEETNCEVSKLLATPKRRKKR